MEEKRIENKKQNLEMEKVLKNLTEKYKKDKEYYENEKKKKFKSYF